MDVLVLVASLFLFCSCAKVSYLVTQGKGQWDLQRKARPNVEVLADASIPETFKQKIRVIQAAKRFFLDQMGTTDSGIYEKTTILNRKAVSTLVIASSCNDIKAREECFPFMGCFPYQGYFQEADATDRQRELEREGLETWARPVHAYSTLGYLTDNILSSFFAYSDVELSELVFHEMLHTHFFVKDDVDFSEALASFFGREMNRDYFKTRPNELADYEAREKEDRHLNAKILELARSLRTRYETSKVADCDGARAIRERFMQDEFRPQILSMCRDPKQCYPLNAPWNNARLAALSTYEEKTDDIRAVYHKKKKSLREFIESIRDEYAHYKKTCGFFSCSERFSDYLQHL